MTQNRNRVFFAILIAMLLLIAWSNRFIQDDAFISFQYARNLADGRGLVWNRSERVDGYTNFLWTVLMAIPIKLGWSPIEFSMRAGLVCLLGVLIIAWRLSARCLLTRGQSMIMLLVLGTNYSFSAWATGGIGTMMQTLVATALVLAAAKIVEGPWPPRDAGLILVSLLAAIGLLVRLDTAVFVAVAGAAVLMTIVRRSAGSVERAKRIFWLIAPAASIVFGWLAWKLSFYGTIFPNTFYARVGMMASLKYGLFYVYIFFFSYWLIWLPFVMLPAVPRVITGRPALRLVAISAAMWLLYAIFIGGDFMEFRLIVPAMPMIAILIVWTLFQFIEQSSIRKALLLITLAGTLHHAMTFDGFAGVKRIEVESVKELAGHVSPQGVDWIRIGMRLGHWFGRDPVVIATTAAGAIPYYSRLETVDMLGLSDAEIARHGIVFGNRPGPRRFPTLDYLIGRKVNLVLGDPRVVTREQMLKPGERIDLKKFWLLDAAPDRLPKAARIVYIPLGDEKKGAVKYLEVLYLVPNATIDRRIQAENWTTRLIGQAASVPTGISTHVRTLTNACGGVA